MSSFPRVFFICCENNSACSLYIVTDSMFELNLSRWPNVHWFPIFVANVNVKMIKRQRQTQRADYAIGIRPDYKNY